MKSACCVQNSVYSKGTITFNFCVPNFHKRTTKMEISLRQETAADHAAVAQVLEAAFQDLEYSDHQESRLVARLRQSPAFIPELSILAEVNGQVVGHILLTRITIYSPDSSFPALALAPVSVPPHWQGRGIGSRLIREAHRIARLLGHDRIVLFGHAGYYPRFGYEPAAKYGIRLPFEAPPENCMVIALRPGGLDGVGGLVEYAAPFYE